MRTHFQWVDIQGPLVEVSVEMLLSCWVEVAPAVAGLMVEKVVVEEVVEGVAAGCWLLPPGAGAPPLPQRFLYLWVCDQRLR